MAIGIQVVFPEETIELDSVYEMPGYVPRALDIRGVDFTRVSEVLINDDPAPNFTVLGNTRLLAQVPEAHATGTIFSVIVLSGALSTTGEESLLRFRLDNSPKRISGVLRLVQCFIKVLFTTPGTDIFAPSLGGGLLSRVSSYVGKDGGKSTISDVAVSLDITTRQIISVQSRNPSLPPSERLVGSKLLGAVYNRNDTSLNIRFRLDTQAGSYAMVNAGT